MNNENVRNAWPQYSKIGLLVLLSVGVPCLAGEPSSRANIFTPPAQSSDRMPNFAEGAKRRRNREAGSNIPNWQQVKMIPSLTSDQREKIRGIYEQAKADVQPLSQRIRQLRQQAKGEPNGPDQPAQTNPAKGGPIPQPAPADSQERVRELTRQIRSKRQATWDKVQSILTEEQRQEFEQMRKGQLMLPGAKHK